MRTPSLPSSKEPLLDLVIWTSCLSSKLQGLGPSFSQSMIFWTIVRPMCACPVELHGQRAARAGPHCTAR
eukprot:7233164-Pyramimonas_sp.AAC.1